MFYLLITLAMGLLMPFQTAANSRLRGVVGPAYVSTLVSFSVSTLALLLVSLLAGIPIVPSSQILDPANTPWWSWFVGLVAVVTITIAIHLFKAIGQLQAMIIPMFSQLIFSLLIDHFGWFGSKVIPLDGERIIGALLLIVGIVMVVILPRLGTRQQSASKGSRLMLWQLLAVVSGCLSASITGAYAQLASAVGNPVQATTVAFFVATVVLLLLCTLNGSVRLVGKAFSRDYPWWMWTGGLCGAMIVFGNAWLVPKVGVGVFSMALLVGQLALSMLMEHFGWLGAPRKPITWIKIVGILLMLGGVALIRL